MERTQFTGETATQMYFARQGVVTPEMARVAEREALEPEFIRAEVARGRMVIPANVHHTALDAPEQLIDTLALDKECKSTFLLPEYGSYRFETTVTTIEE
jgi:hypothetical protein